MPATKKSQRPTAIRFAEKYSVDVSGCWLWMGAIDTPGYGRFKWKGRIDGAHRASWELTFGDIQDDLFVLHRCNVKRCVNPAHLYLGNASTNMRDAIRDGLMNYSNRKPPRQPLFRKPRRPYDKPDQRGEANPNARLTADQVLQIRERYERGGISQQALADEYEVNQTNVSVIVRRKVWASV